MADLLAEMVRGVRPTCRLWQAADGRDALTLLRSDPPDVLFLDLLMPRLNGYELLHEMRRDDRLRDVKVIVITGAEDREERIVAEMVGVTRPGGMTVGEAMACLRRGLDSLLIRTDNSDREP
jgi:CheY-like chemotaxis protein